MENEPPPQRPFAPIRLANRCLPGLWRSRMLPEPELIEAELMETAAAQAGLSDFGDPWFRAPLRRLLEALREEADLNPVGRIVTRIQILKLLKERLRAQRWFTAWPETRRHRLGAPVVIIGPMRSGTTRLHRLLAADACFAHIRMFETFSPVPPWSDPPGALPDHRHRFAAFSLGLLHRADPDTAIIHPTGPHEPEEELGLFVPSAWGMKNEVQWRVPSYARWCEAQDATPAYRAMADLLRLVAWHRGEPPGRRWVLKTPQHMLDLPALLTVFPDAKLIFLHRDPAAVVGSTCSHVWHQMATQCDSLDRRWIGREWLRKTQLKLERVRAVRPRLRPEQAIDVHYEDMNRDWQGELERIYRFLDMDIGPALPAMRAYLERCERNGAFRTHRYDLSWFGLEAGEVRERLADGAEPAEATGLPRPTQDRRASPPRHAVGAAAAPGAEVGDPIRGPPSAGLPAGSCHNRSGSA